MKRSDAAPNQLLPALAQPSAAPPKKSVLDLGVRRRAIQIARPPGCGGVSHSLAKRSTPRDPAPPVRGRSLSRDAPARAPGQGPALSLSRSRSERPAGGESAATGLGVV